MSWSPPTLTLNWGTYFKPDAEDEAKTVDTVIKAKDASIITKRTAVEKVRRIFGIDAVAEYVEALDEEAAKKADLELVMAQAAAAGGALSKDPNDDADDAGGTGSQAPPASGGSGRRPPRA